MCGISGLLGKSKHPNVSFQLATKLFEKSEIRGTDASGFWGCQPGDSGVIAYHKEPRKASHFIHSDPWRKLKNLDLNLLLIHARQSSHGVGDAADNKNNHPFTNPDKTLGLVHNGRILEYHALKKRYEVKSECDSEILLRIFDSTRTTHEIDESKDAFSAPPDIIKSMRGIQKIFSYANDSHMAVAIGERGEGGRRELWLFHNDKRPLWVVDARAALGQIFFCSTAEIWTSALRECPQAMSILGGRKHSFMHMPTEEVWCFSVDDANPVVKGQGQGFYQFRLVGEKEYIPWNAGEPNIPIPSATRNIPILTELGINEEVTTVYPNEPKGKRHHRRHHSKNQWEQTNAPAIRWNKDGSCSYEDEVVEEEVNDDTAIDDGDNVEEYFEERYHGITPLKLEGNNLVPANQHLGKIAQTYIERKLAAGYDEKEDEQNQFNFAGLSDVTQDIVQASKDIEVLTLNASQEGSMTPQDFQDNLDCLQSILADLQGTLCMIEGK